MSILIALVISIVLFAALVALWYAFLFMWALYFWFGILLFVAWVLANIGLGKLLNGLAEKEEFFGFLSRVHNRFFFYTSLFQGHIFSILVFWGFGVMFMDAPIPKNPNQLLLDFIVGGGFVGLIIYALPGMMLYMAHSEDMPFYKKIPYFLYTPIVAPALVAPYFLQKEFLDLMERFSRDQVFAAFLLLSALASFLFWKLMENLPLGKKKEDGPGEANGTGGPG